MVNKESLDGAISQTVVLHEIESKLDDLINSKNLMQRLQFDYDRTLVFLGVNQTGEADTDVATKLIHDGLSLRHVL